jgi:LAT3 family solute carrier family 43 protein 3
MNFWEQFWSREYLLLVLYFSLLMVPLQFYVMTVANQSEKQGNDISSGFQVVYAFASIAGFFAGKLIDNYGFSVVTFERYFSLLFLFFFINF